MTPSTTAHKVKTSLCLILAAHAHFLSVGCGTEHTENLVSNLRYLIPVETLTVLRSALNGTFAESARTLDLDFAAGTFRLIDSGGIALISGEMSPGNMQPQIITLSINNGNAIVRVDLDSSRRIVTIDGRDAGIWRATEAPKLADDGSQIRAPSLIHANHDLLALALEMDDGKYDPASDQLRLDPNLAVLLSVLTGLIAPLGGVMQPILSLFSIMTAIEAMRPAEPTIQLAMSGAYIIEYYLDPESDRRVSLSEFDSDRSVTLLGPVGGMPTQILLRDGTAALHAVPMENSGLAGIRSGNSILVLDISGEQVIAYHIDETSGGVRATGYLAFELVGFMRQFSALPRNGATNGNTCIPPFDLNDAVASFPVPAGSGLADIAANAGLADEDSFCTQLAIHAAVLFAMTRDGFVPTAPTSEIDLLGWAGVAADAGVCRALIEPARSCSDLLRSEDELSSESASDDAIINRTRDAAAALFGGLDEVPERIRAKFERLAS